MKNNKKGFTLIELLAVIVVLAIIMVIATTQVTRAMKTAAVDSFVTSYNTIVKEIKNRVALKDLSLETTTIECDDNGEVEDDTGNKVYCKTVYDLSGADYSVKVTGNQTNGYTLVFSATTTGKFKSIDLTVNSNEKCPSSGTCTATSITRNGIK